MTGHIGLSLADVGPLEEEYLLDALHSGWVAPLGPSVDAFEAELAEYCGREYCVALSSGTAALHLGLIVLGVGPGDIVLTSSMTFAATANAITYTGAEPMFIDSDESGNMDPDLLVQAFEDLSREGRVVKAVLPVHLLGKVADHDRIDAVAAKYGVPVLADAAEALGATLGGRPAASFGATAVVSFNGNKVITTSGGGALLTDDAAMADRVRYLATQARQPVPWYEHTEIGYNYRLSNLLAAVGRAQLKRIDLMIASRRALREQYKELFADVAGASVFRATDDVEDNAWLTSVMIDPDVAGWTADDLGDALALADIESRPVWKPMHLQPVFQDRRAWVNGQSARLFQTGVTLPSGSALTADERQCVLSVLQTFIKENLQGV